jgi:hypothetical protein
MKSIPVVFCYVLLVAAAPALAGNVFGSLKVDARSVGPGVDVRIACGSDVRSTKTDEYGAFSLNVPTGRCNLDVSYQNQWTPSFPIASSEDPARYDFALVNENGRFVLKRR